MVSLERSIQKNNFSITIGGIFADPVRSFIGYIMGAHAIDFWRFMRSSTLASALWVTTMLLVGVFAIENYKVILEYFTYIIIGLMIIGIIVYQYKNKKSH
jgi:membrane protein DedA with SNARE-associated domain